MFFIIFYPLDHSHERILFHLTSYLFTLFIFNCKLIHLCIMCNDIGLKISTQQYYKLSAKKIYILKINQLNPKLLKI